MTDMQFYDAFVVILVLGILAWAFNRFTHNFRSFRWPWDRDLSVLITFSLLMLGYESYRLLKHVWFKLISNYWQKIFPEKYYEVFGKHSFRDNNLDIVLWLCIIALLLAAFIYRKYSAIQGFARAVKKEILADPARFVWNSYAGLAVCLQGLGLVLLLLAFQTSFSGWLQAGQVAGYRSIWLFVASYSLNCLRILVSLAFSYGLLKKWTFAVGRFWHWSILVCIGSIASGISYYQNIFIAVDKYHGSSLMMAKLLSSIHWSWAEYFFWPIMQLFMAYFLCYHEWFKSIWDKKVDAPWKILDTVLFWKLLWFLFFVILALEWVVYFLV